MVFVVLIIKYKPQRIIYDIDNLLIKIVKKTAIKGKNRGTLSVTPVVLED